MHLSLLRENAWWLLQTLLGIVCKTSYVHHYLGSRYLFVSMHKVITFCITLQCHGSVQKMHDIVLLCSGIS
jgi:hypothetical protein